jgi:hypothetical protein
MTNWKETVEKHPLGYTVTIALASGVVVAGVMWWVQLSITAQKDALIEFLRAKSSVPMERSAATGTDRIVTAWELAGPVTREVIGIQYTLLSPGSLPTLDVVNSNDVFEARFSVSCLLVNSESFSDPPLFALGYAIDTPPPQEGILYHQGFHVIQTGRFDLKTLVAEHIGGTAILTGLKPGRHTIGVYVAAHFLAPPAKLRLQDLNLHILRLGSPSNNKSDTQVK